MKKQDPQEGQRRVIKWRLIHDKSRLLETKKIAPKNCHQVPFSAAESLSESATLDLRLSSAPGPELRSVAGASPGKWMAHHEFDVPIVMSV